MSGRRAKLASLGLLALLSLGCTGCNELLALASQVVPQLSSLPKAPSLGLGGTPGNQVAGALPQFLGQKGKGQVPVTRASDPGSLASLRPASLGGSTGDRTTRTAVQTKTKTETGQQGADSRTFIPQTRSVASAPRAVLVADKDEEQSSTDAVFQPGDGSSAATDALFTQLDEGDGAPSWDV